MRKLLAVAGLALLAGCAYPSPQHVAVLNATIGKSETDLVRQYGVPNRSFTSGGSKFLAYHESRIETFPGGWGYGGWGGWHRGWGGGWGGGWGPDVETRDCDTTFELVGGVVKTWSLRGNSC
jgi:hypothetical protein